MHLNSTSVTSRHYQTKTTPYSYRKQPKYWSSLWTRLLLQLFLLMFMCTHGNGGLQFNNLQMLVRNFPGCYGKIHQSYKHDKTAIPIHQLHFLFRSEIYKLASPMFNDSATFYFQDFSKSATKPVRSGFYSFSMERKTGEIRMRTFHINGSVLVSGVCRTGEHVALSPGVMKRLASKSWTFSECDMFWKRLDHGTFVGITGPLCLGSLRQNRGRIGVSMTLSKEQLLLTEGWYRITGRLRLSEIKISYLLQKSLTAEVFKHGRHKSHNSHVEIITNDVLSPYDIPNYVSSKTSFWNKTVESYKNKANRKNRGGYKLKKRCEHKGKQVHRRRSLNNFPQILLALTSGYEVHFLVDLAMCSNIGNISGQRLSFAGKVKNFVYVRQPRDKHLHNGYIQFMTQKNGGGSQGAQVIVRHVTLLSDGRVKVQMFKTYQGQPFSSTMLMSSFQCRLSQGRIPNVEKPALLSELAPWTDVRRLCDQKFNGQSKSLDPRYGGALFTRNPRDRVSAVHDFKALARSVTQGGDLSVVVDLSRCQGSSNRSRHVIGSLVTDVDLVDGGQTVELSPSSLAADTQTDPTHHPTFAQGFLGRVHIHGDVNLTFFSNSQSQYKDNRISSTYYCKLSNDKTSTKLADGDKSVRMFRNK